MTILCYTDRPSVCGKTRGGECQCAMRLVLSISGLAVGTCWDAEQMLTMTNDQTICPGGSDSHFKPLHLGLSMLPNSAGPLTSAGVWTCLKHVIVPFNSVVDVEDGSYTEHCLVRENDVSAGTVVVPALPGSSHVTVGRN